MAGGQTVSLVRRVQFSASHRLHSNALSDKENAVIFGKCNLANGHGHNYVLYVELKGKIDAKTGMIFSLEDLKDVIDDTVMKNLDHRNLNLDVQQFKTLNPTAENIAVVVWDMISKKLPRGLLHKITLHETENNSVVYAGE